MKVRISAKTLRAKTEKDVEMTASEAKLLASIDDTLARYAKLEAKYAELDAELAELEAGTMDVLRKLGKTIMDNKTKLVEMAKKIKMPKLSPEKRKALTEAYKNAKERLAKLIKRKEKMAHVGKTGIWRRAARKVDKARQGMRDFESMTSKKNY